MLTSQTEARSPSEAERSLGGGRVGGGVGAVIGHLWAALWPPSHDGGCLARPAVAAIGGLGTSAAADPTPTQAPLLQ